MGYIEIVGNEIQEYELAMKEEEQKNSKSPSKKTWHLKILHQELEMFQEKLSTAKEDLEGLNLKELSEQVETSRELIDAIQSRKSLNNMIQFYEKKVKLVEYELYCMTKSKYDVYQYATV